jgi:hypothetical protein
MSRLPFRLAMFLIIFCMLTSCNQQPAAGDAPAEEAHNKIETGSEDYYGGDSELSFKSQDTAIQAHENLRNYFGWTDDDTLENMPEDYGGCYFNDQNVLTVCVVTPDDESAALYKEACSEPINIKSVAYSLAEL